MTFFKVLFFVETLYFLFALPFLRADLVGHGGMIRDIAISNSSKRVLTGSFDYSAKLWDFQDQSLIKNLEGHDGPITSVSFIGENRALTTSDDKSTIFWDLELGKPIFRLLGHTHKVMTVSVSQDNLHAVTGGWDSFVYEWSLKDGKSINKIRVRAPVNAVCYLGFSKKIAVGGHDGIIYILDFERKTHLGKLESHNMGITSLSSSKDGKKLLSASIDGSIILWDVSRLEKLLELKGHDKQVYAVEFLDGNIGAISSGADGVVIHWDLSSGKVIRKIEAHKKLGWAVTASNDGRFVISSGADEPAKVWHLATGDQINASDVSMDEPKPWLKSRHPGSSLFKKCARCHAIKKNYTQRSGPHLENIFGRPIGSVPGYNYSTALKEANIIWDRKTISELFKQGPDKYLPGTKMPIQRITSDEELQNLVLYLKELTTVNLKKDYNSD